METHAEKLIRKRYGIGDRFVRQAPLCKEALLFKPSKSENGYLIQAVHVVASSGYVYFNVLKPFKLAGNLFENFVETDGPQGSLEDFIKEKKIEVEEIVVTMKEGRQREMLCYKKPVKYKMVKNYK